MSKTKEGKNDPFFKETYQNLNQKKKSITNSFENKEEYYNKNKQNLMNLNEPYSKKHRLNLIYIYMKNNKIFHISKHTFNCPPNLVP
jgi:hypothetical protein